MQVLLPQNRVGYGWRAIKCGGWLFGKPAKAKDGGSRRAISLRPAELRPTSQVRRLAATLDTMWHYVYILRNERGYQYVGLTEDVEQRLIKHNQGTIPSTAKYKPWKVVNFTAFPTREQAAQFEKYLKSGSGTMFRFRHLAPKNLSDA